MGLRSRKELHNEELHNLYSLQNISNVIPHLQIALGVDISGFRQREKVQDVRLCQKKMWKE
jgi:hypothetical protein